jgi:RNA methyltransferase, TrmH family
MNSCVSVSSRDNPLLQRLRKLVADPMAYRKLGNVWVEGDHLCQAALARHVPVPLAVIADTAWTGQGGLADANNSKAYLLSSLAMRADKVVVVPERLWAEFSSVLAPVCLGYVLAAPAADVTLLPSVATLVPWGCGRWWHSKAQQVCGHPRYCGRAWVRTGACIWLNLRT